MNQWQAFTLEIFKQKISKSYQIESMTGVYLKDTDTVQTESLKV